jgi:hypothetical protein
MDDTPGLGRPQQDDDQLRHILTGHEVGAQLSVAGVRDPNDRSNGIARRVSSTPRKFLDQLVSNGSSRLLRFRN